MRFADLSEAANPMLDFGLEPDGGRPAPPSLTR